MKPITEIALRDEISFARKNFPGNEDMLAALMEEVGELSNALLEHKRGETDTAHVFNEAIQVACMAIRIAEEGDAAFPYEPHFWKNVGQWEAVMDEQTKGSNDEFWRVRWSKLNSKNEYLYAAHYGGNGSSMNRSMAESTAKDWNKKKKSPSIY